MTFPLPFPYLPGDQKTDSFEDRTQQNLDAIAMQLTQVDPDGRALELAAGGTGRKVAFGTATAVFAGAADATVSVTHGLGKTPAYIGVLPLLPASEALFSGVRDGSVNSTSFTAQFRTDDGVAASITRSFYWIAIG